MLSFLKMSTYCAPGAPQGTTSKDFRAQRVSETVAWLLHVTDEETEAPRKMACAEAHSFLVTKEQRF